MGESDRALEILQSIQHLRAEDRPVLDGLRLRGRRPSGREELTTWTAGSLLLAVAALGGDEATSAVFSGERLPRGLDARLLP